MSHVRRLFGTTVLTLALTQVTLAGEGVIYPWVTPPPPPPSSTGTINPVQTDDNAKPASGVETVDLITEVTLSLVQNLFVLL